MENIKKSVKVNKEDYKVEGGRVYIQSDELVKALTDQSLDLDCEEEQGALDINIYKCGAIS